MPKTKRDPLERIRQAALDWTPPPGVRATVDRGSFDIGSTDIRLNDWNEARHVGYHVLDSKRVIHRHLNLAVERLRQRRDRFLAMVGRKRVIGDDRFTPEELAHRAFLELCGMLLRAGVDAFAPDSPYRGAVADWGWRLWLAGGVELMRDVHAAMVAQMATSERFTNPTDRADIPGLLVHRWSGVGYPGGQPGRDVWMA